MKDDKKRILTFIAIIVLITTVMTPIALAKEAYTTEVINYANIDDINIELREYALDKNGKRVPFNREQVVTPNQTVTEIVEIRNMAKDAWLRVKVDYLTDSGLDGLNDECLSLADTNWEKIGDYFYYKTPIKTNEAVDFVDSIHIPEEWGNEYARQSFSLIFSAEAVQKANFTPNFFSEDPWFGTLIEQCVHDAYTPPEAPEWTRFSIEFKGGAEGFVRIGDDFFSNWESLMPGDVVDDVVHIANNYAKGVTIYFSSEANMGSELMKKLNLHIETGGGKIIYDGPLDEEVTKVALGHYSTGDTGTLHYTLTVPKDLGNEYALQQASVKWIFEAVLDDAQPASNGSGYLSGYKGERVQTGDTLILPLLVVTAVAVAVVGFVLVTKKEKKEEPDHDKD